MNTKTLESTADASLSYRDGRYSSLIRPISYVVDLAIVIYGSAFFFESNFDTLSFSIFIGICWIIMSMQIGFYQIHRNTAVTKLLGLIFKQAVFFTLVVFAFFGYYYQIDSTSGYILKYIAVIYTLIAIFKITVYFIFKNYRSYLGGNFRNIVVIGDNKETRELETFLEAHPDYGYRLQHLYDVNSTGYDLDRIKEFVLENGIDEIFCSVKELDNDELLELTDYADNNLRTLKFIPNPETILSKHLKYDYYGQTPILSLREIPLDDPLNQLAKRAFDIIFSLLVIIGFLSWLTPLIAILIKLESNGPIFFKQKRNGLDYQEFECYKFRSMVPNKTAHLHQVSRNDTRITGLGKLLRKTSIDELPQFFNVLKGDMSVVGPRPHMVSHTHMYAERIDKFMVRHFVKPGITGLAQVSGYRGEVESDDDIVGRVRNDIDYIENWSTVMDIRIIFKTVLNILVGDKKAY
ncbi:putative colanic acid biosysnthesis UDP-glucose lipid carrier transferase [Nonlabens sp. Hel1_33_55]|uniref:undecaprenyl-phosphate glucose phosphotransferase n=1 Tax=Nonlabens sp. Hel1_33_55 TaxID=1336802 RepID=UPI000875D601|nr:undecaprenyl-phosphate glucose phosphotransferase [Nonlabens sp. Hel1_33_55]SCY32897.1 putative colanic acid biosysnthesis UDP-glucose lipid carrier transferase [Nonlabens sp. Hel1_33_55]